MSWKRTDKHVYNAIYVEHKKDLTSFAGFTNMAPSEIQHQCEVMTEWGFKGAGKPIIKYSTTWEHDDRANTEGTLFYIYSCDEETP